jgi:hypothetical protein
MEWDRKDVLGENRLDFFNGFWGEFWFYFPFPKGGLNEMSWGNGLEEVVASR